MNTRKTRLHFVALALFGTLSAPGVAQTKQSWPAYSLPFQLRSAIIDSGVRLDSSLAAFNDKNGNLDVAVSSGLSISYRVSEGLAPMLRLAFVSNDAPGVALDGSSLANPLLGARYGRGSGPFKWSLFGASTIPIGTGGGNEPDPQAARANLAATTARPADDAMFAVNYLTPTLGSDFAYVDHGFTAQVGATMQGQMRVRGAESSSALDRFRANAALGIHLGYFFGSHFSVGGDLRYARWLSRPTALDQATGAQVPLPERDMSSLTLAAGLRLHLRLAKDVSTHPGLALLRGFGGRSFATPLATTATTAVQLDVPVAF